MLTWLRRTLRYVWRELPNVIPTGWPAIHPMPLVMTHRRRKEDRNGKR